VYLLLRLLHWPRLLLPLLLHLLRLRPGMLR
jgi:hypothetical protein